MPYIPRLTETYTTQQVVEEFRGYNHNLKIGDGEFYDMQNLTSSHYPLLASREGRGIVRQMEAPSGLLGKSKLAYIDGTRLVYGDEDLTEHLTAAGCAISDVLLPKRLISMGAYIVIYPDKLYINTENYDDCGSIEAKFTTVEGADVKYFICDIDGANYGEPALGDSAPAEPANGAMWIDTSTNTHVLKKYSETSKMWVDIPTVYTKIQYTGIGASFKKYDGVTISGCKGTEEVTGQIEALNGSKIIYSCSANEIVVVGLLDRAYTQTTGAVTVSRTMPDLDFITEAENRLWGCKYGQVNGEAINEIYCCALGDFKNWNQFLGLATDSYVASVGTDGPWTGAITHLGYPIFFKEDCMHKVYISSTGAHQIVDTACRGVQKGSYLSLAVVNELLIYKSMSDVCVYDGSLPVSISTQFGNERYFDAVAGALGNKYYVSMRDKENHWHLFVYDTMKGFWHREDSLQVLRFAKYNGDLYCIDSEKRLLCMNGTEGTKENQIEWMATTGLMGYATVEQKYISRFNFRMRLPKDSKMDIYIQYDSSELWEHVGHIEGTGTKTFMLPVRPRRCDHFQVKLEGRGEVRIYSIAKIHERGSDCG